MNIKPEVQIFPLRLLSEERAKNLLDTLSKVDGVTKMEYKGFNSKDKEDFRVGWIWIEMESDEESIIDGIKEICNEILPFGYDIKTGRFTKYKATTADYLRGLVKEE
ncbi:MAG: methyl-coenzyme M reductase operon protein D [Candidatus Methanofastidiosia archaeon]